MSYTPTNWQSHDKVTAAKLNKIEQGIDNLNNVAAFMMNVSITNLSVVSSEVEDTLNGILNTSNVIVKVFNLDTPIVWITAETFLNSSGRVIVRVPPFSVFEDTIGRGVCLEFDSADIVEGEDWVARKVPIKTQAYSVRVVAKDSDLDNFYVPSALATTTYEALMNDEYDTSFYFEIYESNIAVTPLILLPAKKMMVNFLGSADALVCDVPDMGIITPKMIALASTSYSEGSDWDLYSQYDTSKPFIVTLTPTNQDFSGTMDKTVDEIYAAIQAGKRVKFRVFTGDFEYNEVDVTITYYNTSYAYPSINAYLISDQAPFYGIIFAWTGTTNDGTKQTYSTSLFPLSTNSASGVSF